MTSSGTISISFLLLSPSKLIEIRTPCRDIEVNVTSNCFFWVGCSEIISKDESHKTISYLPVSDAVKNVSPGQSRSAGELAMVGMSRERMNEFLKGPHIARIGTIGLDGEPHVTPVWYMWDGQSIYVVGRKRSSWIEHLRRNPRVAVLIDEAGPPEFKISIDGIAQIMQSDWIETARRMSIKYFGNKTGTNYLEATLDQPRWLVKVTSKKITTWLVPLEKAAGKEGWHPRYYEPGSKWYTEYNSERKTG
jgi:PPOX class probable F420-dependent enzyme